MKIVKWLLKGTPSYMARQWPKLMGFFIDYAHTRQARQKRNAIVFPQPIAKFYGDMTDEAQDVVNFYVKAKTPLPQSKYAGVTVPGLATFLGIEIAKLAQKSFNKERSTALRDFDGSLDMLSRSDHFHLAASSLLQAGKDGFVPSSPIFNLYCNLPTVLQQANLNLAVLIHEASNPDGECAKLAQILAENVGQRWLILLAETPPPLFHDTSGGYAAGFEHLFQDVPKCAARWLVEQVPQDELKNPEAWYPFVRIIGGAGAIAEAAAAGALDATQGSVAKLEEIAPDIFGEWVTLAAKAFYTQEMLDVVIQKRGEEIVKAIFAIAQSVGAKLSIERIGQQLDAGKRDVALEVGNVKSIAQGSSVLFAKKIFGDVKPPPVQQKRLMIE